MVFYGTEESAEYPIENFDTHKGYFSYLILSSAMDKYSNYTGFLLINDDVLLNPWTFYELDKDKIWEGPKWPITIGNFSKMNRWYWWESRWGLKKCSNARQEVLEQFPNIFLNPGQGSFAYSEDERSGCFRGRSDVVYVPNRLSDKFVKLSKVFHKHGVFLEIAVPTLLRMLETSSNYVNLDGIYLPGRVNATPIRNTSYLWRYYDEEINFIHPLKLNYDDDAQTTNKVVLNTFVKKKFDSFTNC